MNKKHHVRRVWKHALKWRRERALFAGGCAALVAVALLFFALHFASPSHSVEVTFTDAAPSGLQIVPASCASSPTYFGECDPNALNLTELSPGAGAVVHPGDTIAYRTYIALSSDGAQSNIWIADTIPQQTTLSWLGGGTDINSGGAVPGPNGPEVWWGESAAPAGWTGYVDFDVTVNANALNASNVCNVAAIVSDQEPTAQSSNQVCNTVSNPSAQTCPDLSAAPNNDPTQCTCAQGNQSACSTVTQYCPNLSAAPNNDPSQCTCAQGNTSACTGGGSCPAGYTYENGSCVTSGGGPSCQSQSFSVANDCANNFCAADQATADEICVQKGFTSASTYSTYPITQSNPNNPLIYTGAESWWASGAWQYRWGGQCNTGGGCTPENWNEIDQVTCATGGNDCSTSTCPTGDTGTPPDCVASTPTPESEPCTVTATPSTIQAGQETTVGWQAYNSGTFYYPGGFNPESANGSTTFSPMQTSTYSFQDSISQATCSAQVIVAPSCTVGSVCTSGLNICGMYNTGTYGADCICSGSTPSNSECVPGITVTQALTVAPLLVQSGEPTTVSWNIADAASCNVTATNGDGTGENATGKWNQLTGNHSSTGIVSQTVYTLYCSPLSHATNSDGTSAQPIQETATVNIVPGFHEQ